MRLTFAIALSLPLVFAAVACSTSSSNDSGTSESNQTEEELAKKSLQILGSPRIEGASEMCNGCHDINQATLRKWETETKATKALLDDPNKTAQEKVNGLRKEPGNPSSPFSASKLGIYAAGLHLDLPDNTKLADTFKQALGATDGPVQHKKLKDRTSMPRGASDDSERLKKEDYETVKKWIDAGLPKLEQLLPEVPRPTTCEQSISEDLKTHILAMKTKGWGAHNKDQQLPMFACVSSDPKQCFTQKKVDNVTDIFAEVSTYTFATTWKNAGTKMRMLHELPHGSSFWSRNSADGRFFSSGGGDDGAYVVDLGKQLDSRGTARREIGLSAQYDPSFMPDNSGLLIQGAGGGGEDGEGGGGGTYFCTTDLFTNAATTNVSFDESQCSSLDNVALYQSVGRRLNDNTLSDYFIVNNTFESDDGFGSDPTPTFGMEQKIAIKVMVSTGTDGGYQIGQTVKADAPYEGDTMMSPTTKLTASRIAGDEKQLGYSIRNIKSTLGPNGYTIEAPQVGKICMDGGKANFSFDERYLVTHHYLTRADFDSDAAWQPFKDKNTSDIFLVDLLTAEKIRVTKMAPGQLALFPHFRSDGWLYFSVRDRNSDKEYYVASDVVLDRP